MASPPHWLITTEPHRFGSGWLSGTVGAVLGIASMAAACSMVVPQWLSLPELRDLLHELAAIGCVQAATVLACVFGILSLILRRTKTLGVVALVTATVAASLLPFATRPVSLASDPALGLDLFALTLVVYTAIFVPLERLWPQRPEQPTFRAEWWTDLAWFLSSALLVQLTTYLILEPAEAMHFAVSPAVQEHVRTWPIAAQLLAAIFLADLVQYWIHYACHHVPLLWRFHRVHHSATTIDWLAGSRLHLVDAVLTRAFVYAPLFLLGFETSAIAAYLAIVAVQATFVHANVRFLPRWIEPWMTTPRFHHWHHADAPADKNFAVHLPIYDRLFGTYYLPGNDWPKRYGLANGMAGPRGFWRQLVEPFVRSPR